MKKKGRNEKQPEHIIMNTIKERNLENSKNKKRKKEYGAIIANTRHKQILFQASPMSHILLMLHTGSMSKNVITRGHFN